MSVTLSSSQVSTSFRQILCYYINSTPTLQVVRLVDSSDRPFERLVFPGQRLLFEAQHETPCEIYSDGQLFDRFSCDRLQVQRLN